MSTLVGAATSIDTFDIERPLLFKLRALEEKQQQKERKYRYADVFSTLVQALRTKDHSLYRHSYRVRYLTQHFAQLLGLPKSMTTAIRLGALFHDIGKIGISDTLLHKAAGLTQQEFEKVKEHPTRGAFILDHIAMFQEVTAVVQFHHEWWNGAGYPYGARQEDIPLGARMVAITDAYEVMTSAHRIYRKPFTQREALEELRRCAGIQFDPMLVRLFSAHLELQRLPAWVD
ncbi:MAG: hypothetical protein NVS4B7_00840 [Ktedonobacteraceae bacterium]